MSNILFFLKPKSEIAYIKVEDTLRQAIQKMEFHKYAAIPMLNKEGKYIGTITEGDLLWGIKNKYNLSLKEAEYIPITEIDRKLDYVAVRADANMEDLMLRAMNQNFVPVIDDQENFIGIVTRKDIIGYCYDKLNEQRAKMEEMLPEFRKKSGKTKKYIDDVETKCYNTKDAAQ